MTRVLVVQDDAADIAALSSTLRGEGFEVESVASGPVAVHRFHSDGADLILLDWVLAGLSGLEVCRTLRSTSNVPIIMVTDKDSEIDKIVALEIGADDYVTKPYSERELVARMRAVLRGRGTLNPAPTSVVEVGPVRMDLDQHQVMVKGEEVTLPLKEFDLLSLLLRNAGRVMTKRQIIDSVWGVNHVGDVKTIDVHIRRLRLKIEPEPGNPSHLMTVRGLGYKFQE
ncbi:response regulator [Streptomyces sp. NPDC059063]|uniref:response regulator n=1 Tax=unclassified Streptomyces TaxID=2593676 RepID=UPI0036C94776